MRKLTFLESSQELPPLPVLPLSGLRPILFGAELCQDLERASQREWVTTNGLGGYASSTILGMNTRRYHGLLVAASRPPAGRVVMLANLEETLVTSLGRFGISTHRYTGVVHPEGFRYLVEFLLDPQPTFFYRVGEILLEKSVFMLPGENATVIGYTLHAAPGPVELAIRPLVAARDFRWVSQENAELNPQVEESAGILRMTPYEGLPPLMIHHSAELVEHSPCWYKNFEYLQEEEEGRKVQEDLWSPGQLLYLLKVGESCAVVASTGRRGGVDFVFHKRRLENTQSVATQAIVPPGKGTLSRRLSWTAESFFTHPSPKETVLLAGFPWFNSWGRDALVALPGLTLATRRFELARSILETLGRQIKGGLIPVRFSEEDGSAEYDSADTSLWFFWAVWHYWRASRDLKFVAKKLLDPLQEIMEAYLEGTTFGIAMAEDGLIHLADEELPLTWMDAREPNRKGRLPGRAITPRFGKPVEVNALWYCSLSIMAALGERLKLKRYRTFQRLGRLVRQNFLRTFFSPYGFLYDRVTETAQDASIRPNMLIAASLPFSPLPKHHTSQVLETAQRHLLTPMGIRSLSSEHPQYRGHYTGDLKERAHAYHQGTVWAWLIGPYVSTVLKVRGLTRATQAELRKQIEPAQRHLEEGGLGSISELFDGDAPHAPRGGVSQAWSVGELLRAIQEAKLSEL